jgi:hypothetical protein
VLEELARRARVDQAVRRGVRGRLAAVSTDGHRRVGLEIGMVTADAPGAAAGLDDESELLERRPED